MGNILFILIIGLIAGALARLLVPGRDPMGLLGTLVLGVIGSIVGNFLAQLVLNDTSGVRILGSTVGAIIVLLVYNAVTRRRRSVV